jgi:DeoR/GlpR family transcriptional regulator of sugar metabolism
MFQIERQEKILRFINESQKANTDELANAFSVSKVTIRRDIDLLASKGLLLKTHGGAVSVKWSFIREIPFSAKAEINLSAKKAIGIAAAQLIENGEIIILDSGSTTLEIAKCINNTDVTVLTNDIKIAMELAAKPNVHVIVSGGNLDSTVFSLIGSIPINFFKDIHVNKTFLGCDAVDLKFGISDRSFESCVVKRAMMQAADEVIMVTDSSKLNKRVFTHICDISAINKLIIDEIDEQDKKAYIEKGVKIITTSV